MEKPASSDIIYNNLLDRIINLELEPGCKISENKIAEEYKVSRSVVRNSIARLAQLGFLDVYPQRGTYVTLIDLEYIKTALLIRISVEKEMLYRFMKKEDKSSVIKKMEENIEQQKKFYDAKEYLLDFKRLDEQFHEYIMLSVETKNILRLINEHLLHISRWRNVYIKSGYKISRLIDEHDTILKHIKDNNLEKALDSMSHHIDTVSYVIKSSDEYKHYFRN
ncbi:GntR family transcriptional regulator [Peptostreptococcus canis]|uniref:GntR family transcriptional regulator n=1 Tax=Peptostreptococcus canis TaxID=1159213 RepID=A0ABR6TJ91_9FIRM|nr:GntR family transcriptional regulator [Peptostreptococcus canis]MBC2575467.1 GntR family transcriptional regulator [Peptostreptococcus canis]MBP1997341.1 DNA-binding GntR family transcriptional regulator [Peptostreptococcus canis]